MNLISIQGPSAPGFFMDREKCQQFHSLLHSMFDSQYFLTNSKYKTDIIYENSLNLNDYIINQLFKYADKSFDGKCRKHFYTSEGAKNTLEAFFIRLYHFTQRKEWYEEYIKNFDEQVRENPHNPITKHLLGCFKHIELSNFQNLYEDVLQQKKLSVDRHQTYGLLVEYLSKFNVN
ncbi:MAG: hypothetical protein RLO81_19440 [Fulvivirga sp.]|uniref:hypothetical protein n=1 Tax=Fulvivirga sp. TaxID=1931237 RepID=UPI0032EFF152